MLAETELWREERSQSAVERELLVKSTLERRSIPTELCEFVCGLREVRISTTTASTEEEDDVVHEEQAYNDEIDQKKGNNSSSRISKRKTSFLSPGNRTRNNSSIYSPSPSRIHLSPSSSKTSHNKSHHLHHNESLTHTFHRLKYFSTRSSAAPLSIALDGSVDKPDARFREISACLLSSSSSHQNILPGRSVRAALKNLIGQVAKIHEGGCSHNNISLQSICLVVDSNFGEMKLLQQQQHQNDNNSFSSPNRFRQAIIKERRQSHSSFSPSRFMTVDSSSKMTLLLTRFDYATEYFAIGGGGAEKNDFTDQHHHSMNNISTAASNNNSQSFLNNASQQHRLSIAQNMNLKRIHHASLAIAPNILAVTVAAAAGNDMSRSDAKNTSIKNENNSNTTQVSGNVMDSAAIATTTGTSAEKLYRLFQQRQQAELFNRAQGRRPLPLAVPSCGPVCDVQGLVSITTILFKHLLEAGDEIFAHTNNNSIAHNKQQQHESRHSSINRLSINTNKNNNHSSTSHQSSSSPFSTIKHRFWSCDVDTALKKYIVPEATAQQFLQHATGWLKMLKRERQNCHRNNNSISSKDESSSLSSFKCAFKVLDEVIASPQLAAFRIESLAQKSSSSASSSPASPSPASSNSRLTQHLHHHQLQRNTNNTITNKRGIQNHVPTNNDGVSPSNRQQQLHNHPTFNTSTNGDNTDDDQQQKCSISTCGAPAVELRWLLSRVLLQLKLPLPDAGQLQAHPFFWSSKRTAQFIVACAQFFCEDLLIEETLKSFCSWPPAPTTTSQQQQQQASSASMSQQQKTSMNHKNTTSSLKNNISNNTSSSSSMLSVLNSAINGQQEDPDGVATRHAETLRLSLQRQHQKQKHHHQTINNDQEQPSLATNKSSSSTSTSAILASSTIMKNNNIFGGLGTGYSPAKNRAHPLYKELFGNKNSEGADGDGENGEDDKNKDNNKNKNQSNKRRPQSSSSSSSQRRGSSDIHISPIRRERSRMLKHMFRDDFGADHQQQDSSPGGLQRRSSSSLSFSKHLNDSSGSLSTGGKRNSFGSRKNDSGNKEDADDDEQPPNCVAKDLNCSSTLVWWGKGEFRADASSHRDNAAVWLRMLTDTVGSSSHPFSTINTHSGRIRNSRSDLLLFIAVLIARMLEGASPRFGGKNIKICGGNPFEFVSIAVHSRFPGLQLILIELLSRRLTDATKFCQFVAEQEMLLKKYEWTCRNKSYFDPSAVLGHHHQEDDDDDEDDEEYEDGASNRRQHQYGGRGGSSSARRILPLFAATKDLWLYSSTTNNQNQSWAKNDERPFSEECAELFQFWS